MNSLLEKIDNFGAIDAENDERLLDYFVKSDTLNRILSYNKSVVVGRKGTGKTAIYKYLENEFSNNVSSLLFRDYPWRIHDKYQNNIVTDKESYVNSWLFLIYIEIIKLIVKNIDYFDKDKKKEVKKLKKWLKRNWGTHDFNYKENLNPKRKQFSFALSPTIMGYSLGSITRVIEDKNSYSDTLGELNKKLQNIIKSLVLVDKNYVLLFDELDLGYDIEDSSYLTRIIGLLLATYQCFNTFNNNVRIYVFIRSDILDVLNFQDKNKIIDNIVEMLDWDPYDDKVNLSLKSLISKRIRENIGSDTDNFNLNWNKIFDSKNIGSNQLKWNHIVERTFNRPRDIIKFLNLVLEKAKKRIETDPKTPKKIINEDIHDQKKDYSNFLYNELKDEVSAKYALFDSYLEILRDIHKVTFDFETYKNSYNSVSQRLRIDANAEIVLERLYEFSIIGFYKAGGGGYGGSKYCYKYSDPKIKFNPKASRFRVHLGFKEYLELVDK